jgi:hypothetical protein
VKKTPVHTPISSMALSQISVALDVVVGISTPCVFIENRKARRRSHVYNKICHLSALNILFAES